MERNKIEFCFKGQRDYIQGPDIYNKVNQFIIDGLNMKDIIRIDLIIHRLISNNLTVEMAKETDSIKKENTSAIFSFVHGDNKYTLQLFESDSKIECRFEFPEEEMVKKFSVDVKEKKIYLNTNIDFTELEIITAMNKQLLNTLYADLDRKWLFTRLQTDRYLNKCNYNSISVELLHNFNFKLTKSLIKIDDRERGYIYFSRV